MVTSLGYDIDENLNGSTAALLVGLVSFISIADCANIGVVFPEEGPPPNILVFNSFNALTRFPICFPNKYFYNYLYENVRTKSEIQG